VQAPSVRADTPIADVDEPYGESSDPNVLGARPHATYTREYRIAPAESDHFARRAYVICCSSWAAICRRSALLRTEGVAPHPR
jgi:hypothetical protein